MLSTYKSKINEVLAERRILQRDLKNEQDELAAIKQEVADKIEAHEIIQMAAQLTQETLQEQLGSVVSMALTAVFEEPYEFVVEFVSKRNTTECNLLFDRRGERCHPMDDSGYGASDIASISLRMSYWASGDTRAIIIMDEPCKNLSEEYKSLAAVMFQEMCRKLDLQVIMISHIPAFREGADKLFMVEMGLDEVSRVTTT